MAGVWWLGDGLLPTPLLITASVVVFAYTMTKDWHDDAEIYREALADTAAAAADEV